MKNLLVLLALVCALFSVSTAQGGTGQPMSDKVVGYWVSSSGTPVDISYSGDPQKAMLSINGGPTIDLWLAGGARGGISVDYTAKDGTKMTGQYNESNDTISVHNQAGTFSATWRRRN